MKTGWKIYWLVVALATTNYLVMVLWSLPQVAEMAGGLIPFDMRPAGYSFSDAMAFLNAIGDPGREFYLNTQQRLDLFYPALLAMSVAVPLVHWLPAYLGWPMAVLAVGAAVFDYLENWAVAAMLVVNSDEVTESVVSTASFYTLAKSVLTTIVLLTLFAVLCVKGIQWLKARNTSNR